MNTALFMHRKTGSEDPGNMPGRQELFELLDDRDIRPLISGGAEAAFIGDEVQTFRSFEDGQPLVDTGRVALSSLGVVVNRLDRSVKYDKLDDPDALPPMINENKVRSLAFRKHRVDAEVLKPLLENTDLRMPTILVAGPESLDEFLSVQPDDHFIVKPDSGTNSQGIRRLSRAGVLKLFSAEDAAEELYGKQIIQPAYDLEGAFPTELRPYDKASTEGFETWNTNGVTKELRIYGFHSPVATDVFPIARAISEMDGKPHDNWFFVDPDSVDPVLMETAADAISKAAQVAGATSLYGTVDFGYGARANGLNNWRVIELNARFPHLIGSRNHAGVAGIVRTMFANQIAATAGYQAATLSNTDTA